MNLTHLFLIDEITSLNLQLDTSLRIAQHLFDIGHKIYWAQTDWLSWNAHSAKPTAKAHELRFKGQLEFEQGPIEKIPLSTFSAIHMRKDPPFDQSYIAATWFLDQVAESTAIYNNPNATGHP